MTSKRPTRVRDARTGRFVPKREAARRPATTVTETVRRRGGKK
ncbi:MAG: multidrug transporter [Chloroflexi bacterium]|nr:multidrug transporter [Chloroflexota bacterium]